MISIRGANEAVLARDEPTLTQSHALLKASLSIKPHFLPSVRPLNTHG
jgi:hypothetical protein